MRKIFIWLFNLYQLFINQYRNYSYSQEGEDLILDRLFGSCKRGTYVDIGAHHPFLFSNTYLFYRRGWMGINIDATPGSMKLFNIFRPRDINLEVGILNKKGRLDYYLFDEPALNSFNKKISLDRDKNTSYRIKRVVSVPVERLEVILKRNHFESIDFLSIDVEGMELEVLKSINLNKNKPKIILLEKLRDNSSNNYGTNIDEYLKKYNYYRFANTANTFFYERK